MILLSLIITLLCFDSIQVREIFSFRGRKDHDLENDSTENSNFYVYDVNHERDHLSIQVFVNVEARNSLSDPASLWTDNKIPYQLSNKYEAEEKRTILRAMEEYKNKTCIRFEPRRKDEAPFILIKPGSGCSATVGKSDVGKVFLGEGCIDKGIVIHELMHTLGFLHEHSRPDRDEFVEIIWENIKEKHKKNFEKYSPDEVQNGSIAYDYNSIMHYGENHFAKNRSIPTIKPLKENVTIGQRDGFSAHDIAKILKRYGCGKETSNNQKTTPTVKPTDHHTITAKTTRKIPAQSTAKSALAMEKETTGSSPTTTARKDIIMTTESPKTTPTEKDKLDRLENAITKLAAANAKSTRSCTIVTKLAPVKGKTSLGLTTPAAARVKPTPRFITMLTKIPSLYESAYGRYKRNAAQPEPIFSKDYEEYETPLIEERIEAVDGESLEIHKTIVDSNKPESPVIEAKLGVDNKSLERSGTPSEDYSVRFQKWANEYRNWWSLYHAAMQRQKATTEPIKEITVRDELLELQGPKEILLEKKTTPTILRIEKQIVPKDDPGAVNFRKGSNKIAVYPNEPRGQMTSTSGGFEATENGDPCSSTPDCVKSSDASSVSTVSASETPCTTPSRCGSLVTDSSSKRVPCSNCFSSTELDRLCTSTSEMTPECARPGTSEIKLQNVISEAQLSEISTSKISSQTVASEKIISESLKSISGDPSVTALRSSTAAMNTLSGTTATVSTLSRDASETVTFDAMVPTLTIANFVGSKTVKATEKIRIFTRKVPVPFIPGSESSTGSNFAGISKSENSKTDALEITTPNTLNTDCKSLGQTTLGNLICASSKPDSTIPVSANTKNDPIKIIPDCMNFETDAAETTVAGQGTSEMNTPQATSSRILTSKTSEKLSLEVTPSKCVTSTKYIAEKNQFKGRRIDLVDEENPENDSSSTSDLENRSKQPKFPVEKSSIEENSRADLTVEKSAEHHIKDNEQPFVLAVNPQEHSTPYHIIRIYRHLEGRTSLRDEDRLWPNGIVPYEISDKYDDQQKGFILEGMEEFKKNTCVRFVKKRAETSYVFIQPMQGCQSNIGKQPGITKTTISEDCYLLRTIVHELMHAIGFVHEHIRPDRDSFVRVVWDNIVPWAVSNFRKLSKRQVTSLGVGYDYGSVMHYSPYDFAKDPRKPTLVPLQAGVKIGDSNGFSKKDILKINKLYNCRIIREFVDEGKEKEEKKEEIGDESALAQSLLQKLLKYFEMNFQRLFRTILRTIQRFQPINLKTN